MDWQRKHADRFLKLPICLAGVDQTSTIKVHCRNILYIAMGRIYYESVKQKNNFSKKRKAAKNLPCAKMTAKAILKARPGTFRFSDRVIDLEVKTDTTLKNSNKSPGSLQDWKSFQKWQIWINKWILWLQGMYDLGQKLFVGICHFILTDCPNWVAFRRCFRRPTLSFSLTTINLSSWTLEGGVLHKSRMINDLIELT